MDLAVADEWFEHQRIDDDVSLIWEPHVDPLIRSNIWHVRGGARDLLIDTGLGIASLKPFVDDLFGKPVTVLATHAHYDHVGGLHEFDERLIHAAEADQLVSPSTFAALVLDKIDREALKKIRAAGYEVPGDLIWALPHAGYDPTAYAVRAAPATRILEDGEIVEAGRRRFEVLHLPGHSPGSIGLWEAATGVLFSGDAVYDGPLIDNLPGCDIPAYIRTMERLRALPVRVVHGGHDPSFGRDRLIEIADAHLTRWR